MYKVEAAEAYLTGAMLDMSREDLRYAVFQTQHTSIRLVAMFHSFDDAVRFIDDKNGGKLGEAP